MLECMQFGPQNSLENEHFLQTLSTHKTTKKSNCFDSKELYWEDKTFEIINYIKQSGLI